MGKYGRHIHLTFLMGKQQQHQKKIKKEPLTHKCRQPTMSHVDGAVKTNGHKIRGE